MADQASERAEELKVLKGIYPDEFIVESDLSACIELPVILESPLQVVAGPLGAQSADHVGIHTVSHLPSLRIIFTLPEDYPANSPPSVKLETSPSWLPPTIKHALEANARSSWEDCFHGQTLFAYIMDLQEAAYAAFGLAKLEIPEKMLAPVLAHDSQAKRVVFEKGTYECGICLDPKKGTACYRMERCGHVYCVECLQDCYNSAIQDGNLNLVKCPAVNCGTENMDSRARRGKKTRLISPRELLKIPLERHTVERFVKLKRKRMLEADKSNFWCFRCKGVAKTDKYPKPTLPLEEMGSDSESDSDSEPTHQSTTAIPKDPDNIKPEDRLAVCEDCNLAFCKVCDRTWHGIYQWCYPMRQVSELTAEDKATIDYINTHTSPCPRCETPVSKSEACNHITCAQCYAHFCYLCSASLNPTNPYEHFNTPGAPCYQQLWVLEEGGSEEGVQFQGVRGAEIQARRLAEEEERRAAEEEERRKQRIRDDFERKSELATRLFPLS